jgi:glycosyltransferase involved in cell wall biosynthesis
MAIHATSLVKNESDVIEQNLRAAVRWCDHIYVFDNGSTDGTWEKVQALATEFGAIVPWKQDPKPFRDGLRGEIFRHFRHNARSGDWWCILDADEFYVDDPREFLKRVPASYNSVWHADYSFRFTEVDLTAHEADARLFDGSYPWNEALRHYVFDDHSECRFFRHWWGLRGLPPANWGPIYSERIRVRHYRYRSPEQIARRLSTRRASIERGDYFDHEHRKRWQGDESCQDEFTWRERLVPSSACHFDSGDADLTQPSPWRPPEIVTRPSAVRLAAKKLRSLLS